MVEKLAHEVRLRGTRFAQQGIHIEFGLRHAGGDALLQPAEGAHQRGPIAAHDVADVFQLRFRLARLEQRRGVGRLDHRRAGRNGGCHGDHHAVAIQQQPVLRAQFGKRIGHGGVVGNADLIGGQRLHQRIAELAPVHEQGGVSLRLHQQMREEHRIAFHIAAAQVGQPRNIVEAGQQMMRRPLFAHGSTQASEFVAARLGRVAGGMLDDGRAGQGGAVRPDQRGQVQIGAQACADTLQAPSQLPRGGERKAVAGHPQRLAFAQLVQHPVDMFRRVGHALFHQLDAATRQLMRGLGEIAAVGP